MFRTRLISGIVLVLLALLTILSGGLVLFMTLLSVSLIGLQELYRVMKVRGGKFSSLELMGYGCVVLYYASLLAEDETYPLMALILALVLISS